VTTFITIGRMYALLERLYKNKVSFEKRHMHIPWEKWRDFLKIKNNKKKATTVYT